MFFFSFQELRKCDHAVISFFWNIKKSVASKEPLSCVSILKLLLCVYLNQYQKKKSMNKETFPLQFDKMIGIKKITNSHTSIFELIVIKD